MLHSSAANVDFNLPENNSFMDWFKSYYPLFHQQYGAFIYYDKGVHLKDPATEMITEQEHMLLQNIGDLYSHQEVSRRENQ